MTDTSREAVERLLENVTPGPWVCMDYTTEDPHHAGWYIAPFTAVGTIAKVNPHFDEDARFIAAARDLVPALLKERDDLRAKMDAVVEALEEIAAIEVFSMGLEIDPRPTHEAKIARAALAKIKRREP